MTRRAALLLGSVLLGTVGAGCGRPGAPAPATPPSHLVDPNTWVEPAPPDAEAPLLAPPPEYGNKVVIARRGAPSAL